MARYKIDLEYGYVSYDEKDYDKAMELYKSEGIRLRKCSDLFDEGVVIAGKPIIQDLTLPDASRVN